MLEKIDSICLPFFQKIADKIQIGIGVNNFQIARILLIFNATVVTAIETIIAFNTEHYVSCVVVAILNPLILMGYWRQSYTIESLCQNANFKNPFERDYVWIRGLIVVLAGGNLFLDGVFLLTGIGQTEIVRYFVNDIESIFLMMMFYFLSCTPKPPSRSKLKKLISSIKQLATTKRSLGYAR